MGNCLKDMPDSTEPGNSQEIQQRNKILALNQSSSNVNTDMAVEEGDHDLDMTTHPIITLRDSSDDEDDDVALVDL